MVNSRIEKLSKLSNLGYGNWKERLPRVCADRGWEVSLFWGNFNSHGVAIWSWQTVNRLGHFTTRSTDECSSREDVSHGNTSCKSGQRDTWIQRDWGIEMRGLQVSWVEFRGRPFNTWGLYAYVFFSFERNTIFVCEQSDPNIQISVKLKMS